MNDDNLKNDSDKSHGDQEASARFLGRKLGFLLGASTLNDETKQAWLALLPQMSLEQIARLIDILEAKYLDERTGEANRKLADDLGIIKDNYQKQMEELNKKTLDEVQALEQEGRV